MSQPGERPDDPQQQRIRPAPRPLRAVPVVPPPPPPVVTVPEPVRPPPEEGSPVRPDRTRMDPLSLDRSTAKKVAIEEGLGRPFRSRHSLKTRSKQWVLRGMVVLFVVGIASVMVLGMSKRLKREASQAFGKSPHPKVFVPSSTDRILDMLEAFLTAPEVNAKAAYVLDRARVQPLMEAAYGSGRLPEDQLRFGVPQPLEPGVSAVPAKVSGPPSFLLHLMVREEHGEPKLDWETYEQELSRKFVRFAAEPGAPGAVFRLVLERTHDFSGASGDAAVRVAAPGSAALADPLLVSPDLAPSLTDALPWNRRRRALVRLEWETPPGETVPRMILREVVRWEFLP